MCDPGNFYNTGDASAEKCYESILQQELELFSFEYSEGEDNEEEINIVDFDVYGELMWDDLHEIEQASRKYYTFDNVNVSVLTKHRNKKILYLTDEEAAIIDGCKDCKLKCVLILNRLKLIQMRELINRLHVAEQEIRAWLKKGSEIPQHENTVTCFVDVKMIVRRMGIPFFKDQLFSTAPPNKDYIWKLESKEFDLTPESKQKKWSKQNQKILLESVTFSYFKYRKRQLEEGIRVFQNLLKSKCSLEAKQQVNFEIAELQAKLASLNNENPCTVPPYKFDVGVPWARISDIDLKGRHTKSECKAMWNIFLHPQINRSNWSQEENGRIIELVKKHNYQDWDMVAKELNTHRSGYLVYMHFRNNLCKVFRSSHFLPEEDDNLVEVVNNLRRGESIPWKEVSVCIGDRSKHQLYHRYHYYLAYEGIKKGTFTEAEDVLLTFLVEKWGKNFTKISKYIPQRTSIQLRNRYVNYLDREAINLGNFTYKDDKKILNYVKKYGDQQWGGLAKQMKRTRAHLRQRHLTLKKYLNQCPPTQLSAMPRRKQKFLVRCQSWRNECTTAVLTKLKERCTDIPTLWEVEALLDQEKHHKAPPKSQWMNRKRKLENSVDEQVIKFFKRRCLQQNDTMLQEESGNEESVHYILKLLELLGANTKMFLKVNPEEHAHLSERERQVLRSLIKVVESNAESTVASPVPSYSDSLLPLHQIKHTLPLATTTLLGLQSLLLKCGNCRPTNKTFITNTSKTFCRIVKQNRTRMDKHTKMMEHERRVFFLRFYAIFRWAYIASQCFPKQLQMMVVTQQTVGVPEAPAKPRKIGRPRKVANPKIIKMLEAKKRKYERHSDTLNNKDDPEQPAKSEKRHRQSKDQTDDVEHSLRRLLRKSKMRHTSAYQEPVTSKSDFDAKAKSVDVTSPQNSETPVVQVSNSQTIVDLSVINRDVQNKFSSTSELRQTPVNGSHAVQNSKSAEMQKSQADIKQFCDGQDNSGTQHGVESYQKDQAQLQQTGSVAEYPQSPTFSNTRDQNGGGAVLSSQTLNAFGTERSTDAVCTVTLEKQAWDIFRLHLELLMHVQPSRSVLTVILEHAHELEQQMKVTEVRVAENNASAHAKTTSQLNLQSCSTNKLACSEQPQLETEKDMQVLTSVEEMEDLDTDAELQKLENEDSNKS